MREELLAVFNGERDWAWLVKRTDQEWTRMAAHCLKRTGPIPMGIELDDVKQEMLLAGWEYLQRWSPDSNGGRVERIERFVTLGAFRRSRDWLNAQRNSYRSRDDQPGRFPLAFSAIGSGSVGDGEDWLTLAIEVAPNQEKMIDRKKAIERVAHRAAKLNTRYRIAVQAFALTLDLDETVEILGYRRLVERLDRNQARRVVFRAVEKAVVDFEKFSIEDLKRVQAA